MFWDYRIIQDKEERYRVVEVFYDDHGRIDGWADSTDTILRMMSGQNNKK